jgi:peptide/nickel transport system permease protein
MGLVLDRMPATVRLASASLVLALVVGAPLGLLAGSRVGGWTDLAASMFALVGQAIPAFWLGTMLIALFAVRLRWLPSSGGDSGSSLVLPAVALSLYPAAFLCRLLRASMSMTLTDDYVRTARAKGLSERRVLLGHAARHAALPALAFAGVQIGLLIGGAVVVEGVFAYPGVGQLTLNAVADRDLPVIQAATVVIGSCIVLASLAVDGIARLLDPRIAADRAPGAWT